MWCSYSTKVLGPNESSEVEAAPWMCWGVGMLQLGTARRLTTREAVQMGICKVFTKAGCS